VIGIGRKKATVLIGEKLLKLESMIAHHALGWPV
jgi:hypothetical protein